MNKITCCCGASIEWEEISTSDRGVLIIEEWMRIHKDCTKKPKYIEDDVPVYFKPRNNKWHTIAESPGRCGQFIVCNLGTYLPNGMRMFDMPFGGTWPNDVTHWMDIPNPPTGVLTELVCDRCGREAYESILEGKVCCMIQKDGSTCEGILKRK
jgi:hypothetical protein